MKRLFSETFENDFKRALRKQKNKHQFKYFDVIEQSQKDLNESTEIYLVKCTEDDYRLVGISSGLAKLPCCPQHYVDSYWEVTYAELTNKAGNLKVATLFPDNILTTDKLSIENVKEHLGFDPNARQIKQFNKQIRNEWHQEGTRNTLNISEAEMASLTNNIYNNRVSFFHGLLVNLTSSLFFYRRAFMSFVANHFYANITAENLSSLRIIWERINNSEDLGELRAIAAQLNISDESKQQFIDTIPNDQRREVLTEYINDKLRLEPNMTHLEQFAKIVNFDNIIEEYEQAASSSSYISEAPQNATFM